MQISYEEIQRQRRRRELRYNALFILALILLAMIADPLAAQMEKRHVALSIHAL